VGVFYVEKNAGIKEQELYEREMTSTGSRVEDYFPLIVHCMNRRGNWKCLTTNDAKKIHHIDFCWTNATKISMKSSVHSRLLLTSLDHYISNKNAFYSKFSDYDFIPYFEPFNKSTIREKKDILIDKFQDKSVIIKPDHGSISNGIIVLDKFNYETVYDHIMNNSHHDSWTISEITVPKLIDGYVVTNRIYFLVVKRNNSVKGYYYKTFMNYRTENKFTGDITNPFEFLTNFMDRKNIPNADELFVKERYVPHEKYLSYFNKDEQEIIYKKFDSIFHTITATMKDDLFGYNDNKVLNGDSGKPHLASNENLNFHLYGVDAIIDSDLNIKIIEINGAPAVNVKTRYYGLQDRLDYFDLMEELFQKTVDLIYPPQIEQTKRDEFVEIYSGSREMNCANIVYYIPVSITRKYEFILDALKKREYMRRTKNFHDKIDFFYGLRERYVTEITNMNYYDELLNFLTSKRTRNASIINKIQGITYYLANKGRIYKKLLHKYSKKSIHKFHPMSKIVFFDGNRKCLRKQIKKIVKKHKRMKKIIVKPVHGSRGVGIGIFSAKNSYNLISKLYKKNKSKYSYIDEVVNHIDYYCNHGYEYIEKNLERTFDGIRNEEHKFNKYKYWMVSEYLDKPHLLKFANDNCGRKYNIRFYVLLNINSQLPTYKDIAAFDSPCDVIDAYIMNDMMVYYAMLEYHCSKMPKEFCTIDKDKYFDKMKHLTNLEIVNNVYDELNKDCSVYYNKQDGAKCYTDLLSNLFDQDSHQFRSIMDQATNITKKTINAVKYDLRPLNRHKDNYKGCFNLLAYDSMLDENGKLWLIEINRGPDIKGLERSMGYDKCVELFDEIFSITVDHHYCNDKKNITMFTKIPINYHAINS